MKNKTSPSKRNSLAGTSTGKSKTSKYYASNPDAREVKKKYDKQYHATPERKRYRVELNKANRRSGGFGDGMDKSHTQDGRLVNEKPSRNRARNGSGNNRRLKSI